ncbi:hypothetical protein QOZ88_01375 [Blastococcus sp. BMG 814]|uniref:Uncharacterized protein n=1 Tax=Blastococcus carthaginiensis TaxID=3050034 RepID=A0ABT9I6T7_9ACTN|nr:hypothetical protein [Blastococcus carthaginiensis]MDP5181279.1 hypothetical protein [Blastococcus carthaginiensis]
MHRSLLRSGLLPAATALALLAGCSGSEPEDTTASEETTASQQTSAPEETTASGTPSAAGSEFCTEATGIVERLTSNATTGNPADLPQTFRDAAEEIRAIEAPEELAADWNALADGVEEIATTLQDIDPTDPNALATLQERLAPLQQELSQSSDNVEQYLVEECGLGLPTEESAPTG